MGIKAKLKQMEQLDRLIDIKKYELMELRERMEVVGLSSGGVSEIGLNFGGSGGSSVIKDKLGDAVVKVLDKEREYVRVLNEYYSLKDEVERVCSSTDVGLNDNEKVLFALRYYKKLTFEQIAEEMDFTYQWVHELHKRMLKKLDAYM